MNQSRKYVNEYEQNVFLSEEFFSFVLSTFVIKEVLIRESEFHLMGY